MYKRFAFTLSTLFACSSVSYAYYPSPFGAIEDTPSVLVKSDGAVQAIETAASDHAGPIDAVPQPIANTPGDEIVTPSESVPSVYDGAEAEAVVSQSAPVYRTVKPSRPYTKIGQDRMNVERRKNAWLRRTFLGR